MCGIVGAVHLENPNLEASVIRMRDSFPYRGPDDSGIRVWDDHGVALGQRRLAIIDLSPLGHNPMSDADGLVWITYNGEVYNYQAIRAELKALGHAFRSDSDTEVILHAYMEWGDKHIERLRGMFAYAIYDRRPMHNGGYRLLLVRDRIGIKPLFYYWDGEKLLFASEIKAIMTYPDVNQDIDQSALFDYLTYMYIPAPKTAYQHIRKLEPGHHLVFDGLHEPKIEQYWDIDFSRTEKFTDEAEAVAYVRASLEEAVALHMIADVPVGVFLSGGLDSSTVTALMVKNATEPIHSFSIGFDVRSHSETSYAQLMAQAAQTHHHERIVEHGSMQNLLYRIAQLYDEPYADASAMPMMEVSRFVNDQGLKVVLSGDGGDEIFGGYRWYDRWLMQQTIGRYALNKSGRHLLAMLGHAWPEKVKGKNYKHLLEGLTQDPLSQYARQLELFTPAQKRAIVGASWGEDYDGYDDYWYFRKYWRPELDPITRIQYLDMKTYLPDDILTKVDRATMAFSVEARPPLLDHVLVEKAFSIPGVIRCPNNQKKYLLKKAMADTLPEPILHRGKKGFSSPLTPWMTSEASWIDDFFKQPSKMIPASALDVVDFRLRSAKIWMLMSMELWARIYSL